MATVTKRHCLQLICIQAVYTVVRSDHGSWNGEYNGYCYTHNIAMQTFYDARTYCRNLGCELVEIDNYSHNLWFYNWVSTHDTLGTYYWIDGNDLTTEGTFRNSFNSLLSYTRWTSGHPQTTPNCIRYVKSTKYWENVWCSNANGWATCRKPMPTVSCSGYCLNGGACSISGVNCAPTRTCSCASGYSGSQCQTNVNECSSNPCLNGGACSDLVNSYSCSCAAGYAGTRCQTNINECASSPCVYSVSCTDAINYYTCTCLSGYEGARCNIETNECSSSPCLNGGACSDLVNSYSCSCAAGYAGTRCETNINECASSPCVYSVACVDAVNHYTCTCLAGYEGSRCDTETNECLSNPCENGGACNDAINQYTCTCLDGTAGTHCETDIDECASAPCQNSVSCNDAINHYTCTCLGGYAGTHCEVDIDECASNPCQNGGTCQNNIDQYVCTCVAGFIDQQCQTNYNECISTPCQNSGQCTDMINGFFCTCDQGWTDTLCTIDLDECTSDPCQNGGACNNLVGLYTCTCTQGFTSTNCEQDIDECISGPCQNGAACNNLIARYTCTCEGGYTGYQCEQDIDECSSSPCQNNGACNNLINMFACVCNVGWTDTVCSTDVDECISSPCGVWGACTDHTAEYSCACIPGITGSTCHIDIDECASGGCIIEDVNATCTDLINGFNCTCGTDWTGTLCDIPMATFAIMEGLIEEGGALEELATTDDTVAQTGTLGDSAPFIVGTMDVPDRPPMSWNYTDMVQSCTYEGVACKREDIVRSTAPVTGNCYTFNHQDAMNYRMKRAGQGHGLVMSLNVGQDEYLPWCDTAGLRVYIRNQTESVYVESVGHVVTPGWTTQIGLAWKEYNRMGQPYGDCVNDPTEVASYYYPGSFSAAGCMRSCYQNEVYKECECMDPRFPGDKEKQTCGLNDRKCVNTFVNEKGDPKLWTDCTCPLACFGGEFDIQISRTRFKRQPIECMHLQSNESSDCALAVTRNTVRLEVYFEQFIFKVYSETPRYPFEQLLSDIGGQLGILAGMSVFSMAEILFTTAQVIVVLITNRM